MSEIEFTVGDLKRQLDAFENDTRIKSAGSLTFYRLKRWGDSDVFFEFNEAETAISSQMKKLNRDLKVAFVSPEG
jgi:hypothetical protein